MVDWWDYKDEVDRFFTEAEPTYNYTKGHVWICHHGHFDTLTIEPLDGGQYEIAVRFKLLEDPDEPYYNYSGYIARPDGCFRGVNTHGH